MNHISLCSGIGGVDLAAELLGFETVAQCEPDPFCRRVLRKNFGRSMVIYHYVKHITDNSLRRCGIEPGTIDLVSAGIPCQPSSVAGTRKGTEDERWIWSDVLAAICAIQPRYVLIENVTGFLYPIKVTERFDRFGRPNKRGRTMRTTIKPSPMVTILSDLAAIGCDVWWQVYGAADVGLAHRRDRVFIVADTSRCWDGRTRERVIDGGQSDVADAHSLNGDDGRHGAIALLQRRSQTTELSGCEELADTHRERGRSRTPRSEDATNVREPSGPERMADPANGLVPITWRRPEGRDGTAATGEDVGDTTGQREREPDDESDTLPISGKARRVSSGTGIGATLGNPESGRVRRREPSRDTGHPTYADQVTELGDTCICGRAGKSWRRAGPITEDGHTRPAAEAGGDPIGGVGTPVAELPGWLFRRVSGPGEAQQEWEASRVSKGETERAAKLKALGNAVCPAQAIPVLMWIRDALTTSAM